ncbi:VTT domain-containing protein [Paenalkalicoccus suaedae]|uniref:VTT domain-containing protein n=1 Tax=Paenalkalicoccus suaedae TaxID=2592382 RepID=A0A859FJL7_9BACI|nr:VTT domain-containing protein [Paenalkalicoccus suaedae]QKS72988.1 VTT domain-containing protein [Paenalkalicoccus suaedae]
MMIQMILEFLRELGLVGLFIGIGVEALSIPFPAAIIFLLYGYLINPTGMELVWISLLSALIYTAVSYIPYAFALKYQDAVTKRMGSKRVKKMIARAEKYREWTIAIGRVLGMGYIVYVATFCKMSPTRYGIFTFIGVLPVAFAMLYLGGLGNVGEVYEIFQQVQYVVMAVIVGLIVLYVLYRVRLKQKQVVKDAK